jgi:hypothetical protein
VSGPYGEVLHEWLTAAMRQMVADADAYFDAHPGARYVTLTPSVTIGDRVVELEPMTFERKV